MKIGCIVHQQMVQLRWHILACLGLIMALPIEEAMMNLKEGDGFYATSLSLSIPVVAGALLAGLIACGNVQADLDEKRYIFWRSKPVGVKTFVALKYIVGLFVASIVISAPVLFGAITLMVHSEKIDRAFAVLIINLQLISLLTYSVCFFCNALVRKTARAWLIGMALVCFLLLLPFILPFSFKDISGDFLLIASTVYISITIGASLVAFILSLFAVSRNWHLQTNLKGLLWAGAALIFLILLLFTHQVANIKVLDEIQVDSVHVGVDCLGSIADTLTLGGYYGIGTSNQKIELKPFFYPPSESIRKHLQEIPMPYSVPDELCLNMHPRRNKLFYSVEDKTYYFNLRVYSIREKTGKSSYTEKPKKAFLCSYELIDNSYALPVTAIDLSDCVFEDKFPNMSLRQVEDKLIVFIQDSISVVQIKSDGSLELIDKQANGLKRYSKHLRSQEKIFKIPLIPISQISMKERVKLTVDVNYWYYNIYSHWRLEEMFYTRTLVDMSGDTISFCLLDEEAVQKYDVIKWDDRFIYCKFRDKRPFTFLDQMFGKITYNDPHFVQDGKLYAYDYKKIMVFDICSNRIRKLGHFERLSEEYSIEDIEVLDNGNILLCAEIEKRIPQESIREYSERGQGQYYMDRSAYYINQGYLTLLKNPE